jgi:tetratricopeptide (TPR) repeat protein
VLGAALVAVALLSTAAPASAQRRQRETPEAAEARTRFETGVALYGAANYEGALAEFEESYRLRAVPVVLFNIAQTLKLLYRYAEAIVAYERYLREEPSLDETRRAAVRQTVAELRRAVASITIEVDEPGAEVRVDGAVVGTSPLIAPLELAAGRRIVEARLEGRTVTEEIEVVGGRAARVALVVPDPEATRAETRTDEGQPALTSRWWFWAGIAGAVLVGVMLTVVIADSGDAEPEPGTLGTVAALRW